MRRVIVGVLIIVGCLAYPAAQSRSVWPSTTLLEAATATGAGAAHRPAGSRRTFEATGATTAGTGSASVVIEVTNVEAPTTTTPWITAGTITLTLGTTATADGFVMDAPWRNVRARVSAISGTGASVTVRVGVGQ